MSFSEKAADAIREAGGRMTAQRQHIIDLLGSASERLDAEGLFEQARVLDPAISLATVYRTLSRLESVGLIRQTYISKEHERKYYEPVAESYYFTCRECHRVIGFRSDHIAQLKHELQARFGLGDINVCTCVDGICPSCQAKHAQETEAEAMTNPTTLDALLPGQSATISRLTGGGAVRRRLMDMGLTAGAEIRVLRRAPLGDPIEYELRGYHLSLRKSEAETILIATSETEA